MNMADGVEAGAMTLKPRTRARGEKHGAARRLLELIRSLRICGMTKLPRSQNLSQNLCRKTSGYEVFVTT